MDSIAESASSSQGSALEFERLIADLSSTVHHMVSPGDVDADDQGRAAPRLRAARHRPGGALAVDEREPGCHLGHPLLRQRRPATSRGIAPGAFPLVPRADAGRPGGCRFFAGGVPGGGCRRPGVLPHPRRQVQSVPPALGGGRAPRWRPGLQHPAGGARLAGLDGEAASARRAGVRQCAGSKARGRGGPCERARSGCPWPPTPRRRDSGPWTTARASFGPPRGPERSSGTRRTRTSPW